MSILKDTISITAITLVAGLALGVRTLLRIRLPSRN